MSAPRLTFLYPHLFKPAKVSEPISYRRSLQACPKKGLSAGFSTTTRQRQETYAQRYGPANEPHPPPQTPTKPPPRSAETEKPKSLSTAIEKEVKAPLPRKQDQKSQPVPEEPATCKNETPSEKSEADSGKALSEIPQQSTKLDAAESHPEEPTVIPNKGVAETKPLEQLLQMESPDEEHKPPHLHAPPYVHHFDTFTLVRDLEKGGFTQAQSVTLMKAVRSLLALNLDVAREGLVSKSDVENVPHPALLCCQPRTSIDPHNTQPTSSAPPAPNYAPRSLPSGAAPPSPKPRSAATCSTKLISSRNARRRSLWP